MLKCKSTRKGGFATGYGGDSVRRPDRGTSHGGDGDSKPYRRGDRSGVAGGPLQCHFRRGENGGNRARGAAGEAYAHRWGLRIRPSDDFRVSRRSRTDREGLLGCAAARCRRVGEAGPRRNVAGGDRARRIGVREEIRNRTGNHRHAARSGRSWSGNAFMRVERPDLAVCGSGRTALPVAGGDRRLCAVVRLGRESRAGKGRTISLKAGELPADYEARMRESMERARAARTSRDARPH